MTVIGSYTVNNVSAPKWGDSEHTCVDVIVDFAHCGPVPFTARGDDPEEHGRMIYAACINGDFGEIAEYTS